MTQACWPYLLADRNKYDIGITGTGFNPPVHNALDLGPKNHVAGWDNIPIIAQQDGILQTNTESSGNRFTLITGNDGKNYGNSHCAKFLRGPGPVKQGDKIAIMGKTGVASGIHTHSWIQDKQKKFLNPDTQGLIYFDQPTTSMAASINPSINFVVSISIVMRAQPVTSSAATVAVAIGTQINMQQISDGEIVRNPATGNSSSTWYNNGEGWINSVYLTPKSDLEIIDMQKVITAQNKQIAELKNTGSTTEQKKLIQDLQGKLAQINSLSKP